MKGSGTPTTGRMPLTMPMFTKVYVKKMTVMAPARSFEKVFDALMAIFIESTMRVKYITRRKRLPIRENREEEVTRTLRNEVEVSLCAFHPAFAENAA